MIRRTGQQWSTPWGGIDDTDAKATMESTVLIDKDESPSPTNPIPKIWDLTALTQQWIDGSASNHGVILWAPDEETPGFAYMFPSSEATSNQPELEVIWSQSSKTVYFLKDHEIRLLLQLP